MTAYDQCGRRFLLRYVWRMEWPAAIQRGLTFHQLVLEESRGMAVEEVVATGEDASM